MRNLAEALDRRVLLCDGSLARQLRAHDLDEARDFLGAPEGIEALSLTRARLPKRSALPTSSSICAKRSARISTDVGTRYIKSGVE